MNPNFGDVWNAFECACGACFDVRAKDRRELAACPLCSGVCKLRGWWQGTNDGYGSRGDARGRLLALQEEVQRAIQDVTDYFAGEYEVAVSDASVAIGAERERCARIAEAFDDTASCGQAPLEIAAQIRQKVRA